MICWASIEGFIFDVTHSWRAKRGKCETCARKADRQSSNRELALSTQ